MEYWLPVLWFGVIGFGVLMYVLLDGFVLGLGILAPFAEDEHQLDHMMNTAAPIWDGNETWLVLGGAGLARRIPESVCGGAVGAVPAGAADADRAGVPRRGFRVPLQGRSAASRRGARRSRWARCWRRSRRA